jgi:hypothetical protein
VWGGQGLIWAVEPYDDDGVDVQSSILGRSKTFSCSPCIQISSGAHPCFCPLGTQDSFPRHIVQLRCDTYHLALLVLRSRVCRSCTSSSPKHFHSVYQGQLYSSTHALFTFLLLINTQMQT